MDKQTYRDYCAAMAMQAVLPVSGNMRNPGATAAQAFDIADAMAAERERREPFPFRGSTGTEQNFGR